MEHNNRLNGVARSEFHKALFVTLAAVGLCADLGAMIFRPEQGAMWDPSVVWHDGKYYAFTMYNKDGRDGLGAGHCLLATSADGVDWDVSIYRKGVPYVVYEAISC